eukprot:3033873-Alexandrium_andersonii.AAC.1
MRDDGRRVAAWLHRRRALHLHRHRGHAHRARGRLRQHHAVRELPPGAPCPEHGRAHQPTAGLFSQARGPQRVQHAIAHAWHARVTS